MVLNLPVPAPLGDLGVEDVARNAAVANGHVGEVRRHSDQQAAGCVALGVAGVNEDGGVVGDEASFRYTRFELGLQWLQVINRLLTDGYTLTELAALTGAAPNSMTYIARGAQWPRFAVGELLLDLYWQLRDDDPTRIFPANAVPGRVPARSSFLMQELPDMPFSVLRPVVAKKPGATRLVEVAAEL